MGSLGVVVKNGGRLGAWLAGWNILECGASPGCIASFSEPWYSRQWLAVTDDVIGWGFCANLLDFGRQVFFPAQTPT